MPDKPTKPPKRPRILLSPGADEMLLIDRRRGLVPRATFILDLALRALVERAERGKGGGS